MLLALCFAAHVSVAAVAGTDYVPLDELTIEDSPLPAANLMGTFLIDKPFNGWATGVRPTYYELRDTTFSLTKKWSACALAFPEEVNNKDTLVSYCVKLAEPLDADHPTCWLMVALTGRGHHGVDEKYFIATKFPPGPCKPNHQTNSIVPIDIMRGFRPSTTLAPGMAFTDELYNEGSAVATNWNNYEHNFYDNTTDIPDGNWKPVASVLKSSQTNPVIKFTVTPNAGATYYALYGEEATYHYRLRFWDTVCGAFRQVHARHEIRHHGGRKGPRKKKKGYGS